MKKSVKSFQRTTEQEISVGEQKSLTCDMSTFCAVNSKAPLIMIITGLTKSTCKWREGEGGNSMLLNQMSSLMVSITLFPLKSYVCT